MENESLHSLCPARVECLTSHASGDDVIIIITDITIQVHVLTAVYMQSLKMTVCTTLMVYVHIHDGHGVEMNITASLNCRHMKCYISSHLGLELCSCLDYRYITT